MTTHELNVVNDAVTVLSWTNGAIKAIKSIYAEEPAQEYRSLYGMFTAVRDIVDGYAGSVARITKDLSGLLPEEFKEKD